MPADQAMTSGDPRTSLEALPDQNLYDVARNPSAIHRLLCLRILVERCSLFATREDVSNEARQLIIDNPLIRKKIDPASAVHALRLPNIIDVAADQQEKHAGLSVLVSRYETEHRQSIGALESTVASNKDEGDLALREAYSTLWLDGVRKAFQLTEAMNAQKAELDARISELREHHAKEIAAAAERLRLLERSPWRRFVDWAKKNVQAKRGWLQVGKVGKKT